MLFCKSPVPVFLMLMVQQQQQHHLANALVVLSSLLLRTGISRFESRSDTVTFSNGPLPKKINFLRLCLRLRVLDKVRWKGNLSFDFILALTVDSHVRRKTSAEQKRGHVTISKPIKRFLPHRCELHEIFGAGETIKSQNQPFSNQYACAFDKACALQPEASRQLRWPL
uniref:Uncharacterized protein n=1 Tax=Timema shepardi TaxID=629360 RepID=A0A7R9B584_TIMSH|nr:unnamed protein product [Timema shepardi]